MIDYLRTASKSNDNKLTLDLSDGLKKYHLVEVIMMADRWNVTSTDLFFNPCQKDILHSFGHKDWSGDYLYLWGRRVHLTDDILPNEGICAALEDGAILKNASSNTFNSVVLFNMP